MPVSTLKRGDVSIAYDQLHGATPTLVWFGGFKSDMAGTKAQALAHWAAQRGQAFVRFDYSGHGRSGGRFEDATISDWLADGLAVIDNLTRGPVAIVGSSMGGWLALLAARARPDRIKGLILIAPAADMTERLMWDAFPEEVRSQIRDIGWWERPSAYDLAPYPITRKLIDDGRRHLIMNAPIRFDGPVHILQGAQDPDVPAAHVQQLAALIRSSDLTLELVADGDHRLSRPQDIQRLLAAADRMAGLLAC